MLAQTTSPEVLGIVGALLFGAAALLRAYRVDKGWRLLLDAALARAQHAERRVMELEGELDRCQARTRKLLIQLEGR